MLNKLALVLAAHLTVADTPKPLTLPSDTLAILNAFAAESPAPPPEKCPGTAGCNGALYRCLVGVSANLVEIDGVLVRHPPKLESPDEAFTLIDRSLDRAITIQPAHPETIYGSHADLANNEPLVMSQDLLNTFAAELRTLWLCTRPQQRRQESPRVVPDQKT